MTEKSFNKNVIEQTKLIFEYQSLVNKAYGYVKVEIIKQTVEGYGDIDGHLYYVYVRYKKENPKADYVSFPQDFETVVSFLLGLLHGAYKDD